MQHGALVSYDVADFVVRLTAEQRKITAVESRAMPVPCETMSGVVPPSAGGASAHHAAAMTTNVTNKT